ncbi:Sodium/potassium-transporting ATPase subunit beta-1-interacting protein [Armadillidium nasatum]|uniref:Sodium/potassium-transporting ATPase subunit beta-1-interacting protein n=1 Tax=Armadillidium nasatum TaxID=96803 RepID=A0A5N5TDV2_9CRUS|nr:Sodium/potassium-transporting ATPase subunit beta-1-interacting protein [Armadillidium nasatum]
MWLPIICNFFNIIFTIFGFFGVYLYRPKYITVYLLWMFIWLAWNIFVICFYLNVGSLSNQSDWLNFGTGSASWWEIPGIIFSIYFYQIFLTMIETVSGYDCDTFAVNSENICAYPLALNPVGSSLYPIDGSNYVIEPNYYYYAMQMNAVPQYAVPTNHYGVPYQRCDQQNETDRKECSPTRTESESPEPDLEENSYQQPMTPRKVKRQNRYRSSGRSQQGRGTQIRNSKGRGTQPRASQRSRRPQYLNPVTQLIDKANESSTSTDSYHRPPIRPPPKFGGRQGHSNPMYVHSRPNSTYSLNESTLPSEPMERPPSVHSSYSNYHGQRPSLNPNPTSNGTSFQHRNTFIGTNHRKNQSDRIRSTFHPDPSLTTFHDSTFSGGDTYSESERPPPYMFGVNSETVI